VEFERIRQIARNYGSKINPAKETFIVQRGWHVGPSQQRPQRF
jgi:hypothetical protein